MRDNNRAIPKLPYDIIFNILSRVSVQYVLRVRSVCTLWREVVSDPSFVKAHLERATQSPTSFKCHMVMTESGLSSTPPYIDCISYDTRALVRINMPNFENIKCVDSEIIASCCGLLVVGVGRKSHFVWNPVTRVYREIPSQYHFRDKGAYKLFGLGVDMTSNSFKVLRVVRIAGTCATRDIRQPPKKSDGKYDNTIAKLYSSQTNSWRRLMGEFPYDIFTNDQAVLISGVPHYVVFRKLHEIESETNPTNNYDLKFLIICFDFTKEKFKEVDTLNILSYDSNFRLGSFGDLLCLVIRSDMHINVWVMNEYGAREYWTRLWRIREPCNYAFRPFVPLCYTKDDEILVEYDYSLEDYSLVDGTRNDVFVYDRVLTPTFNAASYVESLASPPGGELVRYN